jgi:hypothetical protein
VCFLDGGVSVVGLGEGIFELDTRCRRCEDKLSFRDCIVFIEGVEVVFEFALQCPAGGREPHLNFCDCQWLQK